MLPRDLREHGMSAKAFLGIVPVFWFGGLAIYLYRVNASMGGVASQQLMQDDDRLAAISLLLSLAEPVRRARAGGTENAQRQEGYQIAGR
jgi:hypothetical protein